MHTEAQTAPHGASTSAHAGAPSARVGGGRGSSSGEPRPVTRGESTLQPTAHIDWLGCTFLPGAEGLSILEAVFSIAPSSWEKRPAGWQGYEHRIDLGGFGLLGYGGEHQRGTVHFELNAHGCANIRDWRAVQAWCEASGARITRIDLAHDDFNGEGVSIATARRWFDEGQFTTGGRAPIARLVDDLGSDRGKTLYIGQRQNGKLCRVYEKGKQLGDPQSPWCRVEVEYRAKSRIIPYDVLTRPSDYLAGAYPCLAHLSTQQDKVKTLRKSAEIGYERMVECLRVQYGSALNIMLKIESGDPFAVLEQTTRPGTPKRLVHLPLSGIESRRGKAP